MLATAGAALASAAGPSVTIRIEGAKKTLLLPTRVRGRTGWITRDGAKRGECSARSAQGALNVATHGHWSGHWYASYHEYFITSILGQSPKGSDYWGIWVNNRTATVGACDIKLRAGEQLLFAVTNGSQSAASLSAPHTAIAGHGFEVKLVGYGKTVHPLRGVRITGNGIRAATTNRMGIAKVVDNRPGILVLRTAPRGYIRTEAIVHVAR
jgi:hypothetical protein